MKKVIVLILLIIIPFYSFSGQREYVLTCGDRTSKILWAEQMIDNKIHLQTKQADQTNRYIMSKMFQTEKWSMENKLQRTDLTIESRDGKYYITGIFKGEDISKVINSKGYMWFQNIAYNAGFSLKGKDNIRFECFRPNDLKLFVMKAERKGVSKVTGGDDASKINVHLTGILAKFWNCSYLFDLDTSLFLEYRGVQGGPGTPETIMTLVQ